MKRLVPLLALALAGCASTEKIRTVYVNVPVPVSCVPKDAPTRPPVPSAEKMKAEPGPAERYADVVEYFMQIAPYLQAEEQIVDACAKAAVPEPVPEVK